MKSDYVIVGAGITGAVIANLLYRKGKDVIVLDRRNSIGGNCADDFYVNGIRISKYGPHCFRTDNDKVYNFVLNYTDTYKYELCVFTAVGDDLEHWPVQESTIVKLCGENWKPSYHGNPSNFEEKVLSTIPKLIYDKFIYEYTKKQWGTDPRLLSADLASRFAVRKDNDPRLFKSTHQILPKNGYTKFITEILRGIPVVLNCDYLQCKDKFNYRNKLIYTGAIDEFYNYKFGKLKYRTQHRIHHYQEKSSNNKFVVNYPNMDKPYVRLIQWKYSLPEEYQNNIIGTVITEEIPDWSITPDTYEYPYPDEANKALARLYQDIRNKDIIFCGRLGKYKYLDMNQAIEEAINITKDL